MNNILSPTLVLDIETSPMKAFVWDVGKQYVTIDQIDTDWKVMAFAAKWLGEPAKSICYADTRTMSEYALLKNLWPLLDKADIVITQNGQSFDEPRIKARMMFYGFRPYSPVRHFDTYRQNKDKDFTSHSLAYLTDKFCTKYKKLKHNKFPGLSLWKECLKGNIKAWEEMKRYNIHDVLSTEELYLNTRIWAKKTAPSPLTPPPLKHQCIYCKSHRTKSHGIRGNYQRRLCLNCGKTYKGVEV